MLTHSSLGGGSDPHRIHVRPHALQVYSQLLRRVLDEVDDAVALIDADGETILTNRAMHRLLAPSAAASSVSVPRNLNDLLSALGAQVDADRLLKMLDSGSRPRITLELNDGRALSCHLNPLSLQERAEPALNDDHRVMIFREITSEHRELREWRHRAFHDRLTGLPNRDLLLDRLEQTLARNDREDAAVGLIFIDVDGFKQINDEYGHATGDRMLAEIAARLRRTLRQSDSVGRLGGDEFVVVCDRMPDTEHLEQICIRIHQTLTRPFSVDERLLNVGASIGAVLERNSDAAPGEVVARADALMYAAKRAGTGIRIEAERPPALSGESSMLRG